LHAVSPVGLGSGVPEEPDDELDELDELDEVPGVPLEPTSPLDPTSPLEPVFALGFGSGDGPAGSAPLHAARRRRVTAAAEMRVIMCVGLE
jgi:hypothetical protein